MRLFLELNVSYNTFLEVPNKKSYSYLNMKYLDIQKLFKESYTL